MKISSVDALSVGAISLGTLMAVGVTAALAGSGQQHFELRHELEAGTFVHELHDAEDDGRRHRRHRRHRHRHPHDAGEVRVEIREHVSPRVEVEERVRIRVTGSESTAEMPRPLIYVDGVRMDGSQDAVLADIDPERIDRIEVVKGDAAIQLWGEDATGGVIQIFLKNQVAAANPGR